MKSKICLKDSDGDEFLIIWMLSPITPVGARLIKGTTIDFGHVDGIPDHLDRPASLTWPIVYKRCPVEANQRRN